MYWIIFTTLARNPKPTKTWEIKQFGMKNDVKTKVNGREADIQTSEDALNIVADVWKAGQDNKKDEMEHMPLWAILKEYQEKLEAQMKEQAELISQYENDREAELKVREELEKENARLAKENAELSKENAKLAKENTTYKQGMAELTVKLLNEEKEKERTRGFINRIIGECSAFVGNTTQAQVVQNYYPGSTNINQCDLPNACFSFVPPAEQNGYVLPRQAQGERN